MAELRLIAEHGDYFAFNFTSRTMKFFQLWKDKAAGVLNLGRGRRADAIDELEILDGMIQSRYDLLHGRDGLLEMIVTNFNAMAELHLIVEYGDYLALGCRFLKGNDMNDMKWKVDKVDWIETAKRIKHEELIAQDEEDRALAVRTPNPYLNSIKTAAQRLRWEETLVRSHIVQYAERNQFCHSNLERLIENCQSVELANKIGMDKASLELTYRGRPGEQVSMRNCIGVVQKEWFDFVEWNPNRETAWFIASEKQNRKLEALRA